MSKPLTTGEKNRRANIRLQKAIGAKNAKAKAARKVANHLAHVERCNEAAKAAATQRQVRLNLHEERNRNAAEIAKWNREARRAVEARRAAGIPSIGDMLAANDGDTSVVADLLLGGAA